MSKRLTELCSILVESAHGELAAKIFTTLAECGRLTLPSLNQITRIPLRRLKNTVALLTQHHILYYHSTDEEEWTYFQVNWDAAYTIVRSRKVAKLVADREGEAAGRLVSNILQLGHASVGDLEDEYDLVSASKRDSGIDPAEDHATDEGLVNGDAKDGKHKVTDGKITTISEFHSLMRTLLKKGFLVKVGNRSYTPKTDLQDQIRDIVMTEDFPDGKVSGPKKAPLFQSAVSNLKRKWEDEDNYSSVRDDASHGTIMKAPNNKRVKLNEDHLPNGIHHDCMADTDSGPKLPNDMVVRVNLTKCILIQRSQRLERMVDRYLGPVTAAVYGALLRSLDDEHATKIRPAPDKAKVDDDDSDDEDDMLPSANDSKVLDNIDKDIDLASTIKTPSSAQKMPNGVGKHGKARVLSDDPDEAELGIKVEQESDDEDEDDVKVAPFKERNKRLTLIEAHLGILAEHPKRFCIRTPGRKESRVDFAALTDDLIYTELDTMIHARFGKYAIRLVRMLHEDNRLDERQIAGMAMLRIKDVRTILTNLQFHGITDVQEIPKDSNRQPSRTAYLWFFDERRVRSRYLQQTYQGMARLLQRVRVEREGKFRAVIEKAERTDVRGREHELLNSAEMELLREWREVEEKLLVQVARMDDVVGILRDFSGSDTSLST